MELKLKQKASGWDSEQVLIVPYGIETSWSKNALKFYWVLIVPYGIETSFKEECTKMVTVLIVPYGIET